MKPEFKLIRELTFVLANAFATTFIFDFINAKSTALVIVGLISLAILFVIDCTYFRKVILPMFKDMPKEIVNHEIK